MFSTAATKRIIEDVSEESVQILSEALLLAWLGGAQNKIF